MMRLLFLVTLFFSSAAQAAQSATPISFVFNTIRLVDLARLNFSEVQKQNFILDADFMLDTQQVSFEVKNVTAAQFDKAVEDLLAEHGYRIKREGKILAVRRYDKEREQFEKSESEKEVFIYRPRFRGSVFLTDLVTRFFTKSDFTFQRPVEPTGQPGQQNSHSIFQPQADNTQSAFGQIGKENDVLVFNGSPADVKRLQGLFEQLDTPTPEVLINAVVYEVKNSDSTVSAVDLAMSILGGKFGVNFSGNITSAASMSIRSTGASSIAAMLTQLSSDNRFKLVTSPRVRVRSGASATFSVGDEVPVLGQATTNSNGQTVQSVEYKPSGVIFSVQPTIRQDAIDLHINQQISNFVQTTTGVNNSPTLTKRELTSDVVAKDDELIVLGGLDENSDSASKSGLWFLPGFTDKKSSANSHTEILLLLHVQRI